MNKELSARLVQFAEGPMASEFLGMAEETFFADFVDETEVKTFSDIEKRIGEYPSPTTDNHSRRKIPSGMETHAASRKLEN